MGKLLLIERNMRKFVKFLVQLKKKLLQRIKIGASKLKIDFIYAIEKEEKYFHDDLIIAS